MKADLQAISYAKVGRIYCAFNMRHCPTVASGFSGSPSSLLWAALSKGGLARSDPDVSLPCAARTAERGALAATAAAYPAKIIGTRDCRTRVFLLYTEAAGGGRPGRLGGCNKVRRRCRSCLTSGEAAFLTRLYKLPRGLRDSLLPSQECPSCRISLAL